MKLPILVLLAVLASGCGTVLLNTRVATQTAQWELAVTSVTDGPNSMNVQVLRYAPDDGDRFLHVYVSLRNVGAQRKKWNWSRCGVDLGQQEYLPRLVMEEIVVPVLSEGVLELDPGESIDREIIFTYPQGPTLPTRLTCGELVIPLKLQPVSS